MPRFKAILFDFDYTLADSSKGVVECVNHALKGLNLPPASEKSIYETIGLSLPNTFRFLTGVDDKEKGGEFSRLFVERADQVMADMTSLFEEAPLAAKALKNRGLRLGIVSTKFRYRIASILRREGLLDLFEFIVGGEDVTRHKPDPEGLMMAVETLGNTRLSSVYVGDSLTDAETARRAGVPFIAVVTGVTPRSAFKDNVLCVIGDLSELPSVLES